MRHNDGAALMLRYNDLVAPPDTEKQLFDLAAAEFRFNGTSGWNVVFHQPVNLELREVLRDWVEGAGGSPFFPTNDNGEPVAGVTYDSFNRSDADPDINPWQTPGALGAMDSILLAGNNFIDFQNEEMLVGSQDLFALVDRWLAGEENNGLMLRAVSGGSMTVLQFNLQNDPYVTPAILAVFQVTAVPEPNSGLLVIAGIGLLAARRRPTLRL